MKELKQLPLHVILQDSEDFLNQLVHRMPNKTFIMGLSTGITHADFIEVRAPKPILIVSTTRDYFSIQGARETYSGGKESI